MTPDRSLAPKMPWLIPLTLLLTTEVVAGPRAIKIIPTQPPQECRDMATCSSGCISDPELPPFLESPTPTPIVEEAAHAAPEAEQPIALTWEGDQSSQEGGPLPIMVNCPAVPAPDANPQAPKVGVLCPPGNMVADKWGGHACKPKKDWPLYGQVDCLVVLGQNVCRAVGLSTETGKVGSWADIRKWLLDLLKELINQIKNTGTVPPDALDRIKAIMTGLHENLHCYVMPCPPCEQEQMTYGDDKREAADIMKDLGCGAVPSADPTRLHALCDKLRHTQRFSDVAKDFNKCVCDQPTEAECKKKCVEACKKVAIPPPSDPPIPGIEPKKCDEMGQQYCQNANRRPLEP